MNSHACNGACTVRESWADTIKIEQGCKTSLGLELCYGLVVQSCAKVTLSPLSKYTTAQKSSVKLCSSVV